MATIQISFASFSTNTGDYVWLYDCKTSTCPATISEQILKAEGSLDKGNVYMSTTGSLKMWFCSGASNVETGFTAVWSVAPKCTDCTVGKFSDSVGLSTCSDCTVSTFSGNTALVCTDRYHGKFSVFDGASTCADYDVGKYVLSGQ